MDVAPSRQESMIGNVGSFRKLCPIRFCPVRFCVCVLYDEALADRVARSIESQGDAFSELHVYQMTVTQRHEVLHGLYLERQVR